MTLVILLLGLVAAGSALGSYLFYFRPVAEAVGMATGRIVPRPMDSAGPSAPAVGGASAPTPPSLSGTMPVNVLLLGSDTDAKFTGDYNTQTMIVVSIDPVGRKVAMLSIPRDLWIQIPGHGTGKIGVAYGAGGLALARQAVESDFGIPIHYYAWVGLEGFIKVIDTLGGLDFDVSHPIVDDSYPDDVNSPDPYAYRRLYIPAGLQHLDGARTLEYVRSRHGDLTGDFGRSQRQQQVLDALRSTSDGRTIAARLPQLANDLKDSVRTDMTLPELAKFAAFAEQIRSQPVQQYTLLPPKYSDDGISVDGQSIVIPNWPEIRPLVDQIFGLKTAATLPMAISPVGIARATPAVAQAAPKASTTPAAAEKEGLATPTPSSTAPASKLGPTPTAAGHSPPALASTRPAPTATHSAVQPVPTLRKDRD